MDWRTAYLKQAKSDYEVFLILLQEKSIPMCHRLHYLQMMTEKLAKGFLTQPGGTRYPKTHDALVKFMIIAKGLPRLRQICGFVHNRQFAAYLDSLRPLAQAIENLSPEGDDHPNPEYPWEQNGAIAVPIEYYFSDLDLTDPKMIKFLRFVANCFTLISEQTLLR